MFYCLVFPQLFFVMGLPAVITTDQGKEFHNQFNKEMMKVFGIEHRMTTPYHPQANGLVERFNQSLVYGLAKFTQFDRSTWDEKLGEVLYAYNSAIHDSTKHTPFEVMFGRQARLPVDINTKPSYSPEELAKKDDGKEQQECFESRAIKRDEIEQTVKSNIKKAQVKQSSVLL